MVLAVAPVYELDVQVLRRIHEAFSVGASLYVMAALTLVGSGWMMFAILPFIGIARMRRSALSLIGVLSITALVVFVLKMIVARPRPYLALTGVRPPLFVPPTDYSFPSGHAAGAFAFASFLAIVIAASSSKLPFRIATIALLFAVACGIGVSRIALGVHFPIDVGCGAILGAAIGAAGGRFHLRSRNALALRASD